MDPSTALALLLILVGYGIVCAHWPLTACRWCKGKGKARSPSGKAWRRCVHCAGSGDWVRFGAKVLGKGGRR